MYSDKFYVMSTEYFDKYLIITFTFNDGTIIKEKYPR